MFENLDVAAILGAVGFGVITTTGVFSFLALRRLRAVRQDYDRMVVRVRVSMEAAERFLASEHSPHDLRLPILVMLKALVSRDMSTYLMNVISDVNKAENDGSIALTVAKLRLDYPSLADDFEEAAFGLISIAIPLKNAGFVLSPTQMSEAKLTSPQKAVGRLGKLTHNLSQGLLPLGA
jgi:hypothetical protein